MKTKLLIASIISILMISLPLTARAASADEDTDSDSDNVEIAHQPETRNPSSDYTKEYLEKLNAADQKGPSAGSETPESENDHKAYMNYQLHGAK